MREPQGGSADGRGALNEPGLGELLATDRHLLFAVLASCAVFALKLVIIAQTSLVDDEAYYFLWTRHLALGYVEHAPLLTWFLKASALLFGETGLGVRLLGVLSFAGLSAVLYLFGKDLRDRRTGLLLATAFNLTPFFAGASLVMTTDTPLVIFLFLTLWAYHRGLFLRESWLPWAGVFLGLALLSKITAVFVAAAILLYLCVPVGRGRAIRWRSVALSFVIALAVYSPFILWNAQNDFAFVRWVTGRLLQKPGGVVRFAELWAAQLALYFPLVFLLFVRLVPQTAIAGLRGKIAGAKYFLASAAFVPLLYLLVKSYRNKLEANWPATAFVGGIVLVAWHLGERWHEKRVRVLVTVNHAVALVCMVLVMAHTLSPFLPVPQKTDPTARYFRFQTFDGSFKEYYQAKMNHGVRIFALNYQIPSMIDFYIRPTLEAVCLNFGTYHPTAFDFWYDDRAFVGQDFYLVTEGDPPGAVLSRFARVKKIETFVSYRGREEAGRFVLYSCRGYRGRAGG